MSENTNIPNQQSRPSNNSSGNIIPPRPQNFGAKPNFPPRPINNNQSNSTPNMQSRPSMNTQRPAGANMVAGAQRPTNGNPINNQRPIGMNPTGMRHTTPTAPNAQQRSTGFDTNRLSAGEKFERGSRSISHMSGGTPGAKLYRINRTNQDDLMRRKVGGIVLDAEIIDDAKQLKLADNKNKQKTAVIIVLSMLLALSLVYLAVAIVGYVRSGVEANCRYYISGNVPARWVIDSNEETEFAVREGLTSGSIYKLESILVIGTVDKVDIKITVTAKINEQEIFIAGLDGANNIIRVEGENTWIYAGGHRGGGEVCMFEGIDFYGAPESLSSQNISIIVNAEITKS